MKVAVKIKCHDIVIMENTIKQICKKNFISVAKRHDIIKWQGKKLLVSWNFIAATPDVWNLRNGDPGYPGSDAESNVFQIIDLKTLIPIEISDEEFEAFEKILFNVIDKEIYKEEKMIVAKAKELEKQGKFQEAEILRECY